MNSLEKYKEIIFSNNRIKDDQQIIILDGATAFDDTWQNVIFIAPAHTKSFCDLSQLVNGEKNSQFTFFILPGAYVNIAGMQQINGSLKQNYVFYLFENAYLDYQLMQEGSGSIALSIELLLQQTHAKAFVQQKVRASRLHYSCSTVQKHIAAHTESSLEIKSVLDQASSFSFNGLIHIGDTAIGAQANQQNKNLIIDHNSKAHSIPSIEVLQSDIIQCAHGSATSYVDPEHYFYLCSRGINSIDAEKMLIESFLH